MIAEEEGDIGGFSVDTKSDSFQKPWTTQQIHWTQTQANVRTSLPRARLGGKTRCKWGEEDEEGEKICRISILIKCLSMRMDCAEVWVLKRSALTDVGEFRLSYSRPQTLLERCFCHRSCPISPWFSSLDYQVNCRPCGFLLLEHNRPPIKTQGIWEYWLLPSRS